MVAFLLAVPTYWTHPEVCGEEEIFFDHPTPLNTQGTLRRTLESLVPLVEPGVVAVGVVAAPSAADLSPTMEAWLEELLTSPPLPYPVVLFCPSHLALLKDFLRGQGKEAWVDLLSLTSYGAIRNITLVLANLLESEVLVSLDDDEVVEDKEFLAKISADLAYLGRQYSVFGLAGLYENADGRVFVPEPETPWSLFWPKLRWMNQTFAKLLNSKEVLPRTPFDKNLRILHLPPEKPHPTWLKLRQDLVRFAYARRKLREQEPHPELVRVSPLGLAPYPGNFLTDDLEEKAYRSHTLLALEYLAAGDAEGARHTLDNLQLLQQENTCGENAFRSYLDLAARWQELQTWLGDSEIAAQARRVLWGQS
ncbi:MAG: hypothetical protein P8X49_15375 [Syntrophobacterales bacterium]